MSDDTATTASIGLCLPVGNPLYAIARITPVGIYCTCCQVYHKSKAFLKHVENNHAALKITPYWPQHLQKILDSYVAAAKVDSNRIAYKEPGSCMVEKPYCNGCDKAFRDMGNFNSHRTKKNPCPFECLRMLECYAIIGGQNKYYPKDCAYPSSHDIATAIPSHLSTVSAANNSNDNTPSKVNTPAAGLSQDANPPQAKSSNVDTADSTDYPIYFGHIAKVQLASK